MGTNWEGKMGALPPVVALTGHKRAGKDSVGRVLVRDYGYRVVKFAGPIYEALSVILDEPVDFIEENKELAVPWLGVTRRHMLETLGTEWGRERVNPAIWILRAHQRFLKVKPIVITDLRFENEAAAVRSWAIDAAIWRVKRPGHNDKDRSHASKRDIDKIAVDCHIVNSGTLEDLALTVYGAIGVWREAVGQTG